ncbi:MAG: FHA domain-containing protein [Spirulina sp.]
MPTLSLYFPPEFPDPSLADHTHRLTIPRPDADSDEFLVGRSPELDLTLAVKTVSRRHLAITYSYAADRWAIQDLKSTGGTWLNDQALTPYNWHSLTIGDKIHLSSNPPIRVVEDENDTINDDGPATVVSLTPLATIPPAPLDGDRYDDALYLFVQWFTTGTTFWGKTARFLLLVLLAAVAAVAVAAVVIH